MSNKEQKEQEAIEAVKKAYIVDTPHGKNINKTVVCINSHRNLIAVSEKDIFPHIVCGLRLDGQWSWFNGVVCNGVSSIMRNTWTEV